VADDDDVTLPQYANFHDLIKARTLALRQPIQIIRCSTWDEAKLPTDRRSRQDEATRAWNLHVALYYKPGGVPWRLQRNSTDFATCYVGIAFSKNSSRDTLETSVAQVFNQRGDGMIIRGGAARVSSDDRQPHLEYGDAHDLLAAALDAFRQEHAAVWNTWASRDLPVLEGGSSASLTTPGGANGCSWNLAGNQDHLYDDERRLLPRSRQTSKHRANIGRSVALQGHAISKKAQVRGLDNGCAARDLNPEPAD
jgi:hypothetical protein